MSLDSDFGRIKKTLTVGKPSMPWHSSQMGHDWPEATFRPKNRLRGHDPDSELTYFKYYSICKNKKI